MANAKTYSRSTVIDHSYILFAIVLHWRALVGSLHLLSVPTVFNRLALGSAAYYYLLREQDKTSPPQLESTAAWHFLAFFISGTWLLSTKKKLISPKFEHPPAGLFSGLVSHVVSAKLRYPRLVSELASSANVVKKPDTWAAAVAVSSGSARVAAAKKIPDILPSLGASGAIYGAVTLTALAFPESQVALFIPPSYPISIQWGVGGLLLMDIMGVLRGWRYVSRFFGRTVLTIYCW